MSELKVRADTHRIGPPSFLYAKRRNPNLTYRQFNTDRFEPWLRKAFATTVKPFFEGPAHLYLKYQSPFGVSFRTESLEMARGLASIELPRWMKESTFPDLMVKWHDLSVEEREDYFLLVCERQQRRAETADFLYRRAECPELVISFAEDPSNFQWLMQQLVLDPNAEQQYRIPPSEDWDRLNDATRSSLPPSGPLRAFTEDGKSGRMLFLNQFVIQLLEALVRTSLFSAISRHR
jgi:hypothetical protein